MRRSTTPLVTSHHLNAPSPATTRLLRSTSQLQKEVVPSSEDHEMDEIVLAPLPSGTSTAAPSQGRTTSPPPRRRDEDPFTALNPLDAVRFERVVEPPPDAKATDFAERLAAFETTQPPLQDDMNLEAMDESGSEPEKIDDELERENEMDEREQGEARDDDDDSSESDTSERSDPRSDGELRQIENEMEQLEQNVPEIVEKYKLVDRLGEGTFSSVYKAVDIKHSAFDNSEWQAKAPTGKVYVALKRIYVTSSPFRIHNELEILHDLRGAANVAYLIDALRHDDQVIAVMPYNRHQDFRTYYRKASLPMLRSYFSCLFRALAATHRLLIIHRDVKPANFLFDITTGQGVLCDYGLAQKIGGDEFYEWRSECLHSLPGPSWGGLEGRRKAQRRMEDRNNNTIPGLDSGLHGVRMSRPVSLWQQADGMEQEWLSLEQSLFSREDNGDTVSQAEWDALAKIKPWSVPPGWVEDIYGRIEENEVFYKGWRPPKLGSSVAGNQRIGYLKDDRRPNVRANRAGTRGFRAPEVLLKCPDQTVALDIWSAGIILLCFLTRRFPFFNSNDDTEALVEITTIFGKRKMERCAALHNRTFVTNVPNLETPPHANFHALVKSLNPPIVVENSPDPGGPIPSLPKKDAEWYQGSELYQCVDLMQRCLELDCTKRWTAEECLEHPFFTGDYDLGLGRTQIRENGQAQ